MTGVERVNGRKDIIIEVRSINTFQYKQYKQCPPLALYYSIFRFFQNCIQGRRHKMDTHDQEYLYIILRGYNHVTNMSPYRGKMATFLMISLLFDTDVSFSLFDGTDTSSS